MLPARREIKGALVKKECPIGVKKRKIDIRHKTGKENIKTFLNHF